MPVETPFGDPSNPILKEVAQALDDAMRRYVGQPINKVLLREIERVARKVAKKAAHKRGQPAPRFKVVQSGARITIRLAERLH